MSKQKILEYFSDINYAYNDSSKFDTLKRMLTDAVEVVHGEWVDNADNLDRRFHRHDFRCSLCNTRAHYFVGGIDDWWDSNEPNYCPNCGAKMDGVEQHE